MTIHEMILDMLVKANDRLNHIAIHFSDAQLALHKHAIVRMAEHITEAAMALYQGADYFNVAESIAAFWGYSKTLVA